jgi:drug/metabolite transporter (DMT)-like permease
MPVAEVVAIFFIAPVLITALSAILLKESVGLARWSSVAIGMAGVVIMLRPGAEAIRWEGLFAIAAAFAYCCMQLLTRHMHTTASTATMVAYAQISLFIASAVMGMLTGRGQFSDVGHTSLQFLLRSWTLPAESDLALWVFMGSVSAVGTYLVTRGYRLASASVIAPFEYIAMPCAVVWGLMLYSESPDRVAVIGIMLIIGSGLYVMRREQS